MSNTVIDPVCGMTIQPESAVATLQVGEVTHYFCAVACKETYERSAVQDAVSTCCGGGHCAVR